MSGTSLDGVDIALISFRKSNLWDFNLLKSKTISYTKEWQEKLAFNSNHSAAELLYLDHRYGLYLAERINYFLKENDIMPDDVDLIASHGHTLYHQPDKGFTFQLGNGPEIFTNTGIPTVCDFRRQDVAFGGQGAPLVPIGDRHLFKEYSACLNLGGFANISFERDGKRIAFDICPANFVFNHLAKAEGKEYDEDGKMARSGNINSDLLDELNALPFYKMEYPKSMGAEWVEQFIFSLFKKYDLHPVDFAATFALHVSKQISAIDDTYKLRNILITGGGVYNSHLISLLRERMPAGITIPADEVINFKEALIFGFLGVLKWRNEINILSSVTGASEDHSSGVIYGHHAAGKNP